MTKQRRRLRKQPKLKRVHSTAPVAIPRTVVPPEARRRRRRSRLRLRLRLISALRILLSARWFSLILVSVCVWALAIIGRGEAFRLSTLPVQGASVIPASEIIAASALDGQHVFTVDPARAAGRIDQIPGIVSATVTLEWPAEISIKVVEETPIAIFEQGGQRYWINGQGQLIPARGDDHGLLVIRSEAEGAVEELEFMPAEVLSGALQLKQLRSNIESLYYRPAGGLSYQDGRGWRAYFGSGQHMDQKLVVYESIIEDLLERGIQPDYVSVSNQRRPFYRAMSS